MEHNVHIYQFENNKNKLKLLLEYSKRNVEYYKDILVKPAEYYVNNYNNWKEIPILNKHDVQTNPELYLSKNLEKNEKIKCSYTSGSTGKPLKIYKNVNSEMVLAKRLWDLRRLWEKDISNWKLLYFYRNVEDIYRNNILHLGSGEKSLDLSDKAFAKYCKDIQLNKPKWIIGPPIATSRLANFILKENIKVDSIKYAELYGEMLLPNYKLSIEKAFNCKTINLYGAREFNVLSYECPCGEMHPLDNYFFYEIINGKVYNNTIIGELVVTSLINTAMPLIRYSIGDVCSLRLLDVCCGINGSKLTLIPLKARSAKTINVNSKIYSSGVIDDIFSEFIEKYPLSIEQFQCVQKSNNEFDIIIIPGLTFDSEIVNELSYYFKKYFGEVEIDIKYVKNIDFHSSLKSKNLIVENSD